MSAPLVFDLRALPDLPYVGQVDGNYMAASASFILEHNHGPANSDQLALDDGQGVHPGKITRSTIDDNVRRFRNDLRKATEAGAEAVGLLAVIHLLGNRRVTRLPTETGADFALEPVDADVGFEFERVEFSGVGFGQQSTRSRLTEKVGQMRKYPDEPPGWAVVTNFTTMPVEIAMRTAP